MGTMTISRRKFFRNCAVGAVTSVPLSARDGFSLPALLAAPDSPEAQSPICLGKNENAYGPSPKVKQAMEESLGLASRYPDLEFKRLAETISALHGVKTEQVVLGCGSSEILRMAAAAFLGPGKNLVIAMPTFDLLAEDARRLGSSVTAVPLTKQYAHDLDTMLAKVGPSTSLVYICNPNNPTGSITRRQNLETFIHALPPKVAVIVDEAYHHYVAESSSYASFIDRPLNDDRVIVTRTFSAMYALAGLRVGYAIASPQVAGQLAASKIPSGINVVAARAAAAALTDTEYVRVRLQQNENDRQEFLNQANARMDRVIDSHTNFVLLKTGGHAPDVIEHFKRHNILLGPFIPSMPAYVHVTLGTPEEMKEFWRICELLPPHKMIM
jgi:histidinol-phosphate aminotransferase